jgi:hypothetical protein
MTLSDTIHDKNRKQITSIKQQRDGGAGTAAYTLSLLYEVQKPTE